ncbi:PREDICTED: uncharacterized protein LOC106816087 [Priapulus caudatus]|uniref:Uncharacterized protein LOC106816087 n=1 Tax=Priapulus caudatus TaxID=37621 RepID=A0ABM1EVA9_PRICU|nr:PREDICTED: uncharacterized protein LOC106816087 [Priapulus caudatus]
MTTHIRGPLTVHDIAAAEMEIIRYIQRTSFNDALLKSSNIRKLAPMTSRDNIICVGGRLANTTLSAEAKHPWILPNRHPVVDLIIRHYHVTTGHSGIERTLGEIRQRFWIVKGRAAVKHVIFRCIPCRRMRASLESQRMADLPKDRVTPGLAPFTMVGVDFFGPFMVKRARSEVKRYGCLFTCLTTRAVHIEVCHSLETDFFINALQRFISRRGNPVEVRSDNVTNRGGEKVLRLSIREWNQGKIQDFLCQKEIKWIFNPPTASHMGGVWEIKIRTIRSILNSLLDQQPLNDEGLVTLMCIVEGIMNGRPITKLSDDPRDAAPLTPNHLLVLRSGPSFPPGIFVKQDVYRKQWHQVQYLKKRNICHRYRKGTNG